MEVAREGVRVVARPADVVLGSGVLSAGAVRAGVVRAAVVRAAVVRAVVLGAAVLGTAVLSACGPHPVTGPSGPLDSTRVVIPTIELDRPVVRGAQPELDAGEVVLYDDGPGPWSEPIEPGEPGTYWLAAHRTSHGGSFARIRELRPGDPVHVEATGARWTYVVIGLRIVDDWVRPAAVYGTDPDARRLVLQCSWPGERRLLVIAELRDTPAT